MNECIFFPVQSVQAGGCPNPQVACIVFQYVIYKIIAYRRCFFRYMFVNSKCISVVFVKALVCCKPHKALTVPEDRAYMSLRKSVVGRKTFEFQGGVLRKSNQGARL